MRLRLTLLAVLLHCTVAVGQDRPDSRRPGDGRGRRRPTTRPSRRSGRRGGTDWMVRRLAETYKLTEDQKPQVEAALKEMYERQRAFYAESRETLQPLYNQMRELYQQRRAGQAYDEAKLTQLREQITAHWRTAPMTREAVQNKLQEILPPEQYAAGAKTAEEQRQRMRQRYTEMRERYRRMREERRGRREAGQPGPDQPSAPPAPDQRGAPPADPETADAAPPSPTAVPAVPVDPWRQYVEAFIARYRLDDDQRNSVRGILADCVKQRQSYRASHAADYQDARTIDDPDARRERIEQLDGPIDDIFRSLKERLDRIPTGTQRREAGD